LELQATDIPLGAINVLQPFPDFLPPMTLTETLTASETGDHTSLTERAYGEIEELIVTLRLPPGSVLSEGSLASSLGIGRTPVREALQRLSLEGLVLILPRRGVLVSEINVRSQLELLKVRREIERLMVKLAAERTTSGERNHFIALAAALRAAGGNHDHVGFMRLDHQFNHHVAVTCRNEYARRAMGLMQGLSRRFWYMHYQQALDLERSAGLHATIAEGVGQRDPDAAAKACDEHIDYVESFTRGSLDVIPSSA
jgi:DNA-binding GntR family transcriptional regulator